MTKQDITESRFQMWRTLIALTHADHKVTAEEREFFLRRFDAVGFSDDQKRAIKSELDNKQDAIALFGGITDKQDRGNLIYFARLLFWSDGEFAEQEEQILKQLHNSVVGKIDLQEALQNSKNMTEKLLSEYDDNAPKNDGGLLSRLAQSLKILDLF